MRQVLIAAVATLGLAGIAAAQDFPNGRYGYTASVKHDTLSKSVQKPTAPEQGIDYSTTSSYRNTAPATVSAQDGAAATMEFAKRQHR